MREKLHYATTESYELVSLLQDTPQNRYFTYEKALKKLNRIKKFPLFKRNDLEYNNESAVTLWVRELGIEESRKDGYLGNFVTIKIQDYLFYNNKKYKLVYELLSIDKKYHPYRTESEDQNRRMPNWGHPILRAVKNGKEFDNRYEAQSFIEGLTDEFPTAKSISGLNGIRTYIYSRREDENTTSQSPKKKLFKSFILSATQKENGKFYIAYWENNYNNIKTFKFFNYGYDLLD